MSPEPHLGRWAATALKLVAGLATGILLLLAAILAPLFGLLARVAYRPRHIREARRLGLDAGRLRWTMTGGSHGAQIALEGVCIRAGAWRDVLAACTEEAIAAGYAPQGKRGSERYRRYARREKMALSVLEVFAVLAGETIADSTAIVPDNQTGLSFTLQVGQ